jgi:hypothetical protein
MEPAADTTQALQAALDAARQEREELADRLATVDQLVADLSDAVGAGGRTAPARRGRKAATKRAGRKAAAKRATRKRAGKRTTRKAAGRKRTTRRAGKRQGAGRTDRVVEIVTGSARPLSTGDVRARLAQEEPQVSSKLVSAALTYAQRKGRIKRADGGRWTGA